MKEFPRPVGQPMQKSEDKPGLHPFLTRPSSQLSTRKIIRTTFVVVLSGIAMFGAVIFFGLFRSRTALPRSSSPASTSRLPVVSLTPTAAPTTPATSRLSLVPTKDYGNKYKAGLLPVGDGKYVTSAAAKGSIFACSQYAQSFGTDKGGAGSRGPWFVNNNTQYDVTKKSHIDGSISWQGTMTNTISGATRTINTNDLPKTHSTGVFPVASTDPAYAYDKNPNKISAQTLTYALAAAPDYTSPQCMGGEVGVMLTGVALFNAFDAGGRDAGAWEVQDGCGGHPQNKGEYHYHTLSSCLKDVGVGTVIGFALDGFPITGPKVAEGNFLITDDLDECHGITSSVMLDGKSVSSYHYVMTEDFPYSVSCFHAAAASPPGQSTHSGAQIQTLRVGPPQNGGQQPQASNAPNGQSPVGGTPGLQ